MKAKFVNEAIENVLKGKSEKEILANLQKAGIDLSKDSPIDPMTLINAFSKDLSRVPKQLLAGSFEDTLEKIIGEREWDFDSDMSVADFWIAYLKANPEQRKEMETTVADSAKNYFDGSSVSVTGSANNISIVIQGAELDGGDGTLSFDIGPDGVIGGNFDGEGGYGQDHEFDGNYSFDDCWKMGQEWQNSNPFWEPDEDEEGRHRCADCGEYFDEDDMAYGNYRCGECSMDAGEGDGRTCRGCGEWTDWDDLDDDDYCPNCSEEEEDED